MSIRVDGVPKGVAEADESSALGYGSGFGYNQSKQSVTTPRGGEGLKDKTGYRSIFNEYNVFRFNDNNYPVLEKDLPREENIAKTAIDIINQPRGASIFQPKDFLYCARYGQPINRLITLRRFPYPVMDNIFDTSIQEEPDIARMVTYMDQEINPLKDIIKFSYSLNWKPLSAATEDASSGMNGDSSGVQGWMGKIMSTIDPVLSSNAAQGANRLAVNPLQDTNKVHGPVDSIAKTNIRDIGMEFDYALSIIFDYELKSINGVSGKAAFIDLLSNVLACTFNNGAFWPGSRIWTGARPSSFMNKLKFLSPKDTNEFLKNGNVAMKGIMKEFSGKDGAKNAVAMLKQIAMNGMNLALGAILDKVGRPSTLVMNSLLNSEPTGEWHVTIGNPENPIITIGNLILKSTTIEFDTDVLSYEDFPTSIRITCELEPGMPRDKAGIESIFNQGMGRTYWAPTSIITTPGSVSNNIYSTGYNQNLMDSTMQKAFGDFSSKAIQVSSKQMHSMFIDDDLTVTNGNQKRRVSEPNVTSTQAENKTKHNANSSADQSELSKMNKIV